MDQGLSLCYKHTMSRKGALSLGNGYFFFYTPSNPQPHPLHPSATPLPPVSHTLPPVSHTFSTHQPHHLSAAPPPIVSHTPPPISHTLSTHRPHLHPSSTPPPPIRHTPSTHQAHPLYPSGTPSPPIGHTFFTHQLHPLHSLLRPHLDPSNSKECEFFLSYLTECWSTHSLLVLNCSCKSCTAAHSKGHDL